MEIGVLLKRPQDNGVAIRIGEDVEVAKAKVIEAGLDSNLIEIQEQGLRVSKILLSPDIFAKGNIYLVIDTELISYLATKDSIKYWMAETYGIYTTICKCTKEKGFTDRDCWGIAYSYISELILRVYIDGNGFINLK